MPVVIAELPWGQAGAAGITLIIPVLLLAILVKKYIIRSLTYGAITS
jgi:ABC-type glycerol-3-phosphate transport system permease component